MAVSRCWITGTYYEILKPLLEAEFAEFQVKLLGYLPADENFRIAGRHLGLVLPDEQKQPGQQVRELAGRFLQTVRVEEIVRMAESAGALPGTEETAGEAPGEETGYVELKERHSRFLPEGERIRGHEFHYYDSTENGSGCIAVKPVTGRTYSCVVENPHCWMGFPHLYYPSNPAFARRFVEMARESGTV